MQEIIHLLSRFNSFTTDFRGSIQKGLIMCASLFLHDVKWILKNIHSPSLTWNLKMMVSKRNLLFQGTIFRFHIKLWEGNQFVGANKSCCIEPKKECEASYLESISVLFLEMIPIQRKWTPKWPLQKSHLTLRPQRSDVQSQRRLDWNHPLLILHPLLMLSPGRKFSVRLLTWRIIPFRKWLITMVSKSPK